MVVTLQQQPFPSRKWQWRPSAGAFLSPSFSDMELLNSLLHQSREIVSVKPFRHLLKRNSLSMIRKVSLLSILFEELLLHSSSPNSFSHSTILCFEEMYILLQRIKTLVRDLSDGSKMWLLMQAQTLSNTFYGLTVDLSTLLDIFPLEELKLPEDDVQELVCLIKTQCSQPKALFDPRDASLRTDVIEILERIKKEIVPDHDKLGEIFYQLGLRDSSSFREEMESLEKEVQSQNQLPEDKSKTELIIALMGLVRYAKCVLYGGSTPNEDERRRKSLSSPSGLAVPADFRCPITLDMMTDPVVVSTGQTYDREAITIWIQSGHDTCPKTGQNLTHTEFIPNRALKNLIASWCRENKIPFETAGIESKLHAVLTNSKAALEATKMTVSFLLQKLKATASLESASGVVYELRVLSKSDSDSRACIAEAGAIPLLVRYLGSDVGSENPSLQVNAVTTILNLSILEANKTRIMETDGALNGVIEVLRSGATWEAKGNAAATVFSLSGVHSYMKRLGRKTRVVKGLMELARSGPYNTKRDALAAILNLAGDRETVGKMVEGGMVDVVCGVMSDGLVEEGVTVLEAVVKRGGMMAVAAAFSVIRRLSMVLREGSDRARESAAATLVMICRKGRSEAVAELAATSGIERMIWELMGTGTGRGKRKAASLLRILRRWAAGLDNESQEGYTATATIPSTSTEENTRIMVPI